MSPASAQLKGWNVDALAASADGGLLVASLSNFTGRHWTGAVAVLAADAAGSTLKLRELKELRAGVPAIALLPAADQFTGGWGWSLLGGGSAAGLVHPHAHACAAAADSQPRRLLHSTSRPCAM